jgi:Ca-activated chloride channel family protein
MFVVYTQFDTGTQGVVSGRESPQAEPTDQVAAPYPAVAMTGENPPSTSSRAVAAKPATPKPATPKPAAEKKDKASPVMYPGSGAAAVPSAKSESLAGNFDEAESAVQYALDQADVVGPDDFNTEEYDRVVENAWNDPAHEPLSTFSIDVDTASYANVRRFIESGSLPPLDAVRIEELVNYFSYDYAEPRGDDPLAFDTELAACPWNEGHYLLRVGLQSRRIAERDLPPSNLVFLVDVSGSMAEANKLPLVKESLKLLAGKMRQQDRISIVVYAGAAGQVLPPTSGARKDAIMSAIDNLEAGGSTAGGEGIELAYQAAKEAFMSGGNNRVVLATDGDFNVGASSDAALVRLIEEKRKSGIFLTVLGFGMGNYKDSKMQKLADSGNGNYAYVDSMREAEKVLSKQMAGTLYTLAKDVKIQIEFNPAMVASYRLIGYEKRLLAARDFEDDTKDAGELGAGHSVTALYEIVPASGASATRTDLKYQQTTTSLAAASGDLMTIKFRYKKPDGDTSALIEKSISWKPVPLRQASANTRFAAAVAEWGMLLRDSEYRGSASWSQVADLAVGAKGSDVDGYRAEFIRLVAESARLAEAR